MAGMGYAVMGTSSAKGDQRAMEAAQRAIASPLLEAGAIDGARGILINITGSSSLKLAEVNEASSIIQGAAHEDANIIFGAVQDERMKDEVKITVIATGFKTHHGDHRERMHAAAQAISHARTAAVYEHPDPVVNQRPEASVLAPTARPVAAATTPSPVPQRENSSIADVKSSVKANYEEDDLDVPAFIRKRNENQ
jgi:cell division protein FtsZ